MEAGSSKRRRTTNLAMRNSKHSGQCTRQRAGRLQLPAHRPAMSHCRRGRKLRGSWPQAWSSEPGGDGLSQRLHQRENLVTQTIVRGRGILCGRFHHALRFFLQLHWGRIVHQCSDPLWLGPLWRENRIRNAVYYLATLQPRRLIAPLGEGTFDET